MLLSSARSREHYPKSKLARQVVEYLLKSSTRVDFSRVSLRTLKMGYNLAESHPQNWQPLFLKLLPRDEPKKVAIARLLKAGVPPKQQETKFLTETGMSRRSFYNYRKRMGLTRPYGTKKSMKKGKLPRAAEAGN